MSTKELLKSYQCNISSNNSPKEKINCYAKKGVRITWKIAGILSIIGSVFTYIGYLLSSNADEYSQSLLIFIIICQVFAGIVFISIPTFTISIISDVSSQEHNVLWVIPIITITFLSLFFGISWLLAMN